MKFVRAFAENVFVAYAADVAIGVSAAIATWLFRDAIWAAVGSYNSNWYTDYWYLTIVGVAVLMTQAFLLWKYQMTSAFIWSIVVFLLLWLPYAATLFPPESPLLTGISTEWRFAFHVLLLCQFIAILFTLALVVITRAAKHSKPNENAGT